MRSGGAGALAAVTDLLTLTGLAELAGVAPRVASIPALTLGAIVMFFGQKYLAFQSSGKPKAREMLLFALIQLGGFVLTAFLFDLALRGVGFAREHYVLTRLVVTNLVWLGYSFPLWHFVFPQPKSG